MQHWAGRCFTRQNAAIWTTAALPPELRLGLPDGTKRRPPEPHSTDPLPARFPAELALGLDCVAEQSLAMGAAWRILLERSFDVLRHEHAVVYDVDSDVTPIGRGSRTYSLLTDPLPEQRYRAGQLIARVVEQMLHDGVTEQEVGDDTAAALRARAEPKAALAMADSRALDVLLDRPIRTEDELNGEQSALTAEQVTEALREAHATALYALPVEVLTSTPLRSVAPWSTARLHGRTFWRPGEESGRLWRSTRNSLTIASTGVMRGISADEVVTVPYDDCAAVLAWADGTRQLIGQDGFRIDVEPWAWSKGAAAVAMIDADAPADVVVDMGDGQGPPPQEPRRRRPGPLGLLVWGLLSIVFTSFAFTATSPTDHDAAGRLAGLGCDRSSSLAVFGKGPGPRVAQGRGEEYDRLRAACREVAAEDVVFSGLGGVSLLTWAAVAGTRVVRWHRHRRG